MFKKILIILMATAILGLAQAHAASPIESATAVQQQVLASHSMSLAKRYPIASVNKVFRDNILLTLHYMSGDVKKPADINWDLIHKDFRYEVVIPAGKAFAFHEDFLSEFNGKVVATTNAHYGPEEGFVSDGYLYGDGVCHLASLMNWAARDAGLKVVAPVNHNFAKIPEIDAKYGTAIYYMAGAHAANQAQNLYIENTTDKPITMVVAYKNDNVTVSFIK